MGSVLRDLTEAATSLGGQYIKYKYGAPAVAASMRGRTPTIRRGGGSVRAQPAFAGVLPALPQILRGGAALAGGAGAGAALTELFNSGEIDMDEIPPGYVFDPSANCGTGAIRKKTRRRRKRLATTSDIKDLAALKAVIGQGKMLEAWIATRRMT